MERKIENGSRVAEREKKNTGNFSLHNLVRIRADIGDCEWKFNSQGLSPLLKKRRKEYISSNFSIIQFLQFVSQPNIYLNISHFNFCNEGKTTQAQWNIIVSYFPVAHATPKPAPRVMLTLSERRTNPRGNFIGKYYFSICTTDSEERAFHCWNNLSAVLRVV